MNSAVDEYTVVQWALGDDRIQPDIFLFILTVSKMWCGSLIALISMKATNYYANICTQTMERIIMREQLLKVKVLEVKMDFDNSGGFDTRP